MTDETKFKLLAAFRHIGQRIDMSDFNARLVFQKQTYLMQELGLRLGNAYGWYIRGPYSRDAASDGFQLASIQDHVKYLPELSRNELDSIEEFKKLILEARMRFRGKDEAYFMELLGSLHFLLKYGYPKSSNRTKALERFSELKPRFKKDMETALGLLDRFKLS